MANDKKMDIGTDPPVLVGGGGSSLIWVNYDQHQTGVNPNGFPGAPSPSTPSAYALTQIANGPVRLYFNDGTIPGKAGEQPLPIPIAGRKSWYIRFEVPRTLKRRKKAKR